MKMTKRRKSLQDKLRKRFGWKTISNSHTGWTSLIKEKNEVYSHKNASNDLFVTFNETALWGELIGKHYGKGVLIEIRRYDDFPAKEKDVRYLSASLTFEELEIIYNIAKEKRFETIAERSTTQEEKEN